MGGPSWPQHAMRYRGAPRLRRVAPSDGGLGGPRFHPSVYEPGEVSRACEAPAVALRRDDQAVNADLPENLPDWAKKFGYGEYIHLEHHKPCCAKMMKGTKFFREIESNCWDAGKRMEECDTRARSETPRTNQSLPAASSVAQPPATAGRLSSGQDLSQHAYALSGAAPRR